jgi:cytochrome b561
MQGYGTTARILHWATVLLVVATIPAGLIMTQEGLARPTQDMLFIFHKNVGVILLALVLLRLVWRALNPAPPLPATVPDWQRMMSLWVHRGLYLMLAFMAVTGYLRVTLGGFPIEMLDAIGAPRPPRNDAAASLAQSAHFLGKFVLMTLILLHVAGALFHGLVKRDGVFGRMWPPIARS